jgi:hypothetical protein
MIIALICILIVLICLIVWWYKRGEMLNGLYTVTNNSEAKKERYMYFKKLTIPELTDVLGQVRADAVKNRIPLYSSYTHVMVPITFTSNNKPSDDVIKEVCRTFNEKIILNLLIFRKGYSYYLYDEDANNTLCKWNRINKTLTFSIDKSNTELKYQGNPCE